jgi:hypothetical protein
MTEKLYIIGNGFDLHHGLRTSYMNFRDNYVKKRSPIFWNYLLDIYGDTPQQDDLWWRDFENMLGRVDYASLANSHNGEAIGFMKVRNFMQGTLPPLFGKWIKEVDTQIDLNTLTLVPEIDTDSWFFTFNYTMLLERFYNVDDSHICHIHDSIKHPDDIIVGHDSDGGQLVKYVQEYNKDYQKTDSSYANSINQYVINGAKKVKDRIISYEIEGKFNQYSDIKHFVVMGFSLNDIDIPYIKMIIEVNKNILGADWTLYWYSDGEDEYMINKLLELGIDRGKINTPIKW